MNSIVAGLDFGTSNSAIGYATASAFHLHTFEQGAQSVPTALFYDYGEAKLVCGRDAERRFLQGFDGRYLRALKSILGTSLAGESTRLGQQSWPFRSLLVRFLSDLKSSVERSTGMEVSQLIAGRPVRFIDESDQKDAEAEGLLRAVLEECGFRDVQFMYEPVAALIDSLQSMQDPKYILVADIGGGTSDFSVARRSSAGDSKQVAGFEILANHGVHIGGTDLDKTLSLKAVMPELGYGSEMHASMTDTILPVPSSYYFDLATWHKIHFCYSQATRREVRDVLRKALEPWKIERLADVLDRQSGHQLANAVEQLKIALSTTSAATLVGADIGDMPAIAVSQKSLSDYFQPPLARIGEAVRKTLEMAGVNPNRIDHVVMTGGSTLLPDVCRTIVGCVPDARVVATDPFVAVARGLTKAAQRTFLGVSS
jgi:hypothetical chaperone protein